MEALHDNRILSYEVDASQHRIVLRTRSEVGDTVDVAFDGVQGYLFERDTLGSVIYSLDEMPIEAWLEANATQLDDGRSDAWPGPWNESLDSVRSYLESRQSRVFVISSSYGLRGWVLASECRTEKSGGNVAV